MRLRAVKQAELFVADPEHIYDSVTVTPDGVNVTFMFIADAVTLLDQDISIIDIEGYRTRPAFRGEFGRGVNSVNVAAAQDSINVQSNFDFQNAYKIFDKKADITALIDNTDVRDIRNGIGRTFDYVEAVDSAGETVGIDEFIVGSPPLVVPPISRRSATLGLIENSIDPVSFVGKFPIKSPQAVGATEKPAVEIRKTSDFTAGRQYENFRRSTTKAVSSQSRYRRVTAVSRFVPVKVNAVIPLADAESNDSLFLVVRANLPNGKMLSRFVFQAPSLREAIDNPSSVSISRYLKTVKTIARSVQISGSRLAPQSLSGFVRTFRGEPRNDTYYTSLTSDLFLRRRIPGTRIERRSGTDPFYGGFAFSSRVIRNKSNDVDIALRNASKQDSDDVKFQVTRKLDNLVIKVRKIASDVVESILLRRNITRGEQSFSHLSTDASKCRSTDRSPLFVDDTCEVGHDYEYAIGLIDKFGSLEVSDQKQRYTFLRKQEGVSLRITNVSSRLENNNGKTTRIVSFRLSPKQVKDRYTTRIAVLKSNGIPTDSINDTVKSTTSYEPIFYFEITREDIDTGEIERCGIFTNKEFIDDSAKVDSELPLTPLKTFGNYKYTVKLGLESAAALIPTQYALAIARDGKKYPLHSYKFKKVDRLSNATPSEQELQGVSSTLFSLIDTGVESFVTVTGSKQKVSITNVDIVRNRGGFNTVRWSVAGNVEIVDHYRIYASADGLECLLGCSLRTAGDNVFFDSEMFDRVGLVTYRVVPVLLDFSEAAAASDSIFTLRSEPDFIVERSE